MMVIFAFDAGQNWGSIDLFLHLLIVVPIVLAYAITIGIPILSSRRPKRKDQNKETDSERRIGEETLR